MATLTEAGRITPLRFDTSDQTGNLRVQIASAKSAIPKLAAKSLEALSSQLSAIGFLVIDGEVTDPSLLEELAEIQSLASLRLPVIEIANRVVLMRETGIHSVEEQLACADMIGQLLNIGEDDGWSEFRSSLICQLTALSDAYAAAISEKLGETERTERVRLDIQEALRDSTAGEKAEAASRPVKVVVPSAHRHTSRAPQDVPAEHKPIELEEKAVHVDERELIKRGDSLYRSGNYKGVLTFLKEALFPDSLCLKGRAYTKLGQFKEAQKAFDGAIGTPNISASQRHFYMHRRAQMWLEVWKKTNEDKDLEGCTANLLACLNHGSSLYPALIALDMARIAHTPSLLMPYMLDLAAHCAVIFFEEGCFDHAFEMIFKYPHQKDTRAVVIAELLKENRVFDAVLQLCGEPIKTPFRAALLAEALRHDKRRMEEEEARFPVEDISPQLCRCAYEGGMLLLKQRGYLHLSKRLLSRAWTLQRNVDTKGRSWIEINTAYAANLARLREFKALQSWSSHWALFIDNGVSSGKAATLYNLIQGFVSHHHMGQTVSQNVYEEPPPPNMVGFQEAQRRGDRLVKRSFLVTEDYVRDLLEKGREHFEVAAQDPYWKRVLDHYFQ